MTCRTRLPLGYWLCNESGERIGDPDAVWAHEVESATKLPSEDPRRFELIKNLCQNGSLVLSYSPETNAKRILATADAILAQLNKEPTS